MNWKNIFENNKQPIAKPTPGEASKQKPAETKKLSSAGAQ